MFSVIAVIIVVAVIFARISSPPLGPSEAGQSTAVLAFVPVAMKFSALVLTVLAASAGAVSFKGNSTVPITEKVIVESVEVYGQSSGTSQINACTDIPQMFVDNPKAPEITVCGVSTKVTIYLRNRCVDYNTYQHTIGVCDTKAPSSTCQSVSPATLGWTSTAQSYKIESC